MFLPLAGFALLFRINLCSLLFQCGCGFLWGEAGRFCNVHMPGMAHCPWCSYGWWGHNLPTATILLAQAGLIFAPSNISWRNRLILSLIAFPVAGAIVGFLFAVFSGYPVFLGIRLS